MLVQRGRTEGIMSLPTKAISCEVIPKIKHAVYLLLDQCEVKIDKALESFHWLDVHPLSSLARGWGLVLGCTTGDTPT